MKNQATQQCQIVPSPDNPDKETVVAAWMKSCDKHAAFQVKFVLAEGPIMVRLLGIAYESGDPDSLLIKGQLVHVAGFPTLMDRSLTGTFEGYYQAREKRGWLAFDITHTLA